MNLTDHLLQSTGFAITAGAVTLILRGQRARVRYWIWLAASLKFLVPFSLLVGAGSRVEWRTAAAAPPSASMVMVHAVGLPAPASAPTAPAPFDWQVPVWAVGASAILARWALRWQRASSVLGGARPAGSIDGVRLYESPAAIEPAVFGVLRPRVVLSKSIAGQLPRTQLHSVLAHEICHVRHGDNLTAALHMVVETIFWFHPLVWWIGARLVEEREHACDQEVVERGGDPETYAAAILAVCRFCLESPVLCAAGIAGANLEERIARIVTAPPAQRLAGAHKLLLAALGAAAICGPLAVGLWQAPALRAQERNATPAAFEVASVKTLPEPKGWPWPEGYAMTPKRTSGRLTWVTGTRALLYYAFHVQRWQAELPASLHDAFYQVDAKLDPATSTDHVRLMVQSLLRDRFHLAAHRETREINGYTLVVGRGGPKVKPFADKDEPATMPPYLAGKSPQAFEHRVIISKEGELAALTGRRVSMAELAEGLEEEVQTFVLDQTGMPGNYYFGTKFVHVNEQRAVDGPSLFAALQETLGLRLEKQKGPVEILVVEHIDATPTGN